MLWWDLLGLEKPPCWMFWLAEWRAVAKWRWMATLCWTVRPSVVPPFGNALPYVMQQDILTPTQTVRESLWFSANLRLPNSYSKKDKLELVEKMLKDLGLEKCADTYIGDDMIRGVSGGEKKRTCVGIELIMKPKLIFLDEPTSGLDSYAAHNVVLRLKDLAANDGCNVLCTIHQPSSEAGQNHLFKKGWGSRSRLKSTKRA